MQTGIVEDVRQKERTKVKRPDQYRVILHNDDYTTMEFVVEVGIKIFHKSVMDATRIMLQVHKQGRGTIGVYSHDIAVTKIRQTHALARQRDYPLRCTMEKA